MHRSLIPAITGRRMPAFAALLLPALLACQCISALQPTPVPIQPPVAPDLEAPPQEEQPAPPSEGRRSVSGNYRSIMDVLLDLAEHLGFVGMLRELDMDVRQSDITFDGPDPFVDVVGVWNENDSFEATGSGTVAGFPDVTVRMVGMITYERYEAYYIMGAGGELPQGQSITFRAQGVRVPDDGTEIGRIVPEDLEAFLAGFVPAIQTSDPVLRFARLNPEVIVRYGPEGCQAYFESREPDPTYAIVVTSVEGPGPWDYTTDERTTTIENVWTVHASVTSVGETADRELHFAQPGAFLTWFTDCGEPVE